MSSVERSRRAPRVQALRDTVATEQLRVVVFSDAIPGRNGVGTFYDDLSDALEEHVGAIRIVAPSEHPAPDEPGLTMRMPGDPTQRVHIPSLRSIWSQARWTKPHVILAATPSVYGMVGLAMAVRLRTGSAFCYHTEFPKLAETYWDDVRSRIIPFFLRGLDKLLVRLSPAVLAPNQELREILAAKGRNDAHVVGTPAPKSFVEAPLASPPGEIRSAAFIGRLAPEKRVEQVISAAERLQDVRFRIVGDGPLRPLVDDACDRLPNLEAHPWLDREGVREIIDGTDMLVLPSRHETFGTAAFEAMIRGRLTLVSPACGINEWPTLRRALFVMQPEEDVTAALHRLRGRPATELRQIASSARNAALDIHHRAVADWLNLLQRLARDPVH